MHRLPVSEAAVTATEVVFAYDRHVAVDRSTFTIPTRGITALIGPNGSGKSTLLNGIAGLMEPAAGSLSIGRAAAAGHLKQIAYVLQGTEVNKALPVTVREVVTMGRYADKNFFRRLTRIDRTAIEAAMARMDIQDIAARHISDLSGGQRQRVFVAQGLAQDHDILVLDEPVTGLDLVSAKAIDDVIHDEQTHGCTVIMTTHDLAEARVADHVLLLSNRVVASGPPRDVLTMDHLTEAYGASLLHMDGERLFIDDPHHHSTPTQQSQGQTKPS
ncbi:MAG TPA: metal ABC transporter ATP-binding protein [Actinobacteria bacterium]|nr:metal ABC transporter ATP-binding protein [Actinomycetota bacterium]